MCHGFLYNWCVFEGELDFEEMIDRIFRVYLNSVVKKLNSTILEEAINPYEQLKAGAFSG